MRARGAAGAAPRVARRARRAGDARSRTGADGAQPRSQRRWRQSAGLRAARTSAWPTPASSGSSRRASTGSPIRAALDRGVHHAREACRLDAGLRRSVGHAGFVLQRAGAAEHALAAARRAVVARAGQLAPSAAPGVRRLGRGAAARGAPCAHAAARPGAGALACGHGARRAAGVRRAPSRNSSAARGAGRTRAAGAVQRRRAALAARAGAAWLAATRRGAMQAFERELAFEERGQLYARECCANTWYAIGAVAWQRGDVREAIAAFEHALQRVHGHPLALVGLPIVAPADAVARRAGGGAGARAPRTGTGGRGGDGCGCPPCRLG